MVALVLLTPDLDFLWFVFCIIYLVCYMNQINECVAKCVFGNLVLFFIAFANLFLTFQG